jgi:hypothetical protein
MKNKTDGKPLKHEQNALDNELDVLREILKWTKVTSIPYVKKLLEEILESDKERLAYHLSTGLTAKEIALQVGINFSTITNWWDRWNKLGIVEKISVKGGERGVRLFDLKDFGIPIPKNIPLKQQQKTNIK